MNVFLARQPIFDNKMNVIAYELLYRTGNENEADVVNGELATGDVIINSLVLLGLDKITGGKKAFINFTKDTIIQELPKLFTSDSLVVEILEDVVPDKKFIEECLLLKELGYTIALDDFISTYEYDEIIDLADILKVDFLLTSVEERKSIIEKYHDRNIKFLAEKVETREEFVEAMGMGYSYFQGYFFSKPVVLSSNDVRTFSSTYARILGELSNEEPNYTILGEIIETDMAMSYKLLRLINSPAFYSRNKISSITHALTMLGLKEIRNWISLLMVRDLGKEQPSELIMTSLIRGKMCELLSKETKLKSRSSEAFLMGLFSLIDVILSRRLDEVIYELPLSQDIKDALLKNESDFSNILIIVKCYEHGEWSILKNLLKKLNIDFKKIYDIYLESISWVEIIEKNI